MSNLTNSSSLFQVEITAKKGNKTFNFQGSQEATNLFYCYAAQGKEVWLYLEGSTLLYADNGTVTNREGNFRSGDSMPVYAGKSIKALKGVVKA